jgi:hypothetical protein
MVRVQSFAQRWYYEERTKKQNTIPEQTNYAQIFVNSSKRRVRCRPESGGSILDLGTGLDDILGGLARVLLEVVVEELTKLLDLSIEVGGTSPALGRVEDLVGNVAAGLGDLQVEGLVSLVLVVGELAAVDGVEDGTGVLERATLAASGGTGTDPTGVEEPGVGLVLLDLLGEHGGVAHGVESQEGLGETR